MHRLKTGALLQASVVMGAACGAPGPQAEQARAYGAAWGWRFPGGRRHPGRDAGLATLGKTAGKDAASDKPTYVSLLGLERRPGPCRRTAWPGPCRAGRQRPARTRVRWLALADMVVRRSR